MKKRFKRIIISIGVLFGILSAVIMAVFYFFIPSEIKLVAGEEHLFNFEIPLRLEVSQTTSYKDRLLILRDAQNQEVKQSVPLNKPISVTMLETGRTDVKLSWLGIIPIKTVAVEAVPETKLIPCGEVVGIKIDTSGVLVLGVSSFEADGKHVIPCKGLIDVGDLILSCNDQKIETKEDFRRCIEASHAEEIKLNISHKGQEKVVHVKPCFCTAENEYKIGLWIKDSTQGIGTLTYINPENGSYGALGHGITDSQTHMLTPIRSGEIMEVAITHVTKGVKGQPGELGGIIDYDLDSQLGDVRVNKTLGIFGEVTEAFIKSQKQNPMPIALQDEVHEGKAVVLVDLTGEGAKTYDVELQKVARYSAEPSKGMVIKIVDPELLSLTNGIIQGMSGSPILQDGKIIGAITHVFIHDPTRGYGIFIENMLNNAIK